TPVLGKKSPIGTLALGSTRRLFYTREDLDFLSTTANQLGIAVENLRLLEQVLRSQRQWMNTFDSIQDLILAHDSEYRIIKANKKESFTSFGTRLNARLWKKNIGCYSSRCRKESLSPRRMASCSIAMMHS